MHWDPISYKRPRSTSKYLPLSKIPEEYIRLKKVNDNTEMKKNSGEIFESLQVDPISGDYYLVIPEEVINELSWYEDTEIKISLEGNEVILSERGD